MLIPLSYNIDRADFLVLWSITDDKAVPVQLIHGGTCGYDGYTQGIKTDKVTCRPEAAKKNFDIKQTGQNPYLYVCRNVWKDKEEVVHISDILVYIGKEPLPESLSWFRNKLKQELRVYVKNERIYPKLDLFAERSFIVQDGKARVSMSGGPWKELEKAKFYKDKHFGWIPEIHCFV